MNKTTVNRERSLSRITATYRPARMGEQNYVRYNETVEKNLRVYGLRTPATTLLSPPPPKGRSTVVYPKENNTKDEMAGPGH